MRGTAIRIEAGRPRRGFRLLVILGCLLLTPLSGEPLLQTAFELSVVSISDDDSTEVESEMLTPSGASILLSRRSSRSSSLSSSRTIPDRTPAAPVRARLLPLLPGCEHSRRNGIGAPLLC